jgi:lipopolysaccharide transport system ATP-binding protein
VSQATVVFDRVWKKFRRGERHDSLRDLVPSIARRILGRTHPHDLDSAQDFWAVKEVSFEVRPGEALGVIGPNGAGKSTILKLLTKILRPTRGACAVRGRIGALIEVSAGFHPDLTGRENIYLQGAVMGMRRAEIGTKFDAIVDFSGLSEFIDTPIKRYSSGMNARLGFSIAAHLNPEVLIIDEVLAVGDAAFQQRCYERIRALRANGVTLVFVSHNLAAVEALCDRTLVMWHGEPHFLGDPRQATDIYLQPPDQRASALPAKGFERHGNGAVEITGVRLLGGGGQPVARINSGAPLGIEVDVRGVSAPKEVVLAIGIIDSNRMLLFGENGSVKARPIQLGPGESAVFKVLIESFALPEGRYYISVAVHSAFTQEMYDWHKAAYPIDISIAEDITRVGRLGLSTLWSVQYPDSDVADRHRLSATVR